MIYLCRKSEFPLSRTYKSTQDGPGSRNRQVKGFLSRRTWYLLAGALLVNGQVVIFGTHIHKAKKFEKGIGTKVP